MHDTDLVQTYDYTLPDELVASEPTALRSGSRLMVVDVAGDAINHDAFATLPDLLRPEDLLVFNDARVVPARLHARKETGGAVELFVVDVVTPSGGERWTTPPSDGHVVLHCMTRTSKKLSAGMSITIEGGLVAHVVSWDAGLADVRVATAKSAMGLLEELGDVPLPPYIVKRRKEEGSAEVAPTDRERYQTVYANAPGAVAAPTAGLHFDAATLERIDQLGARRRHLTLLVGPGTFRPVKAERLSEHEMHFEEYVIPEGLSDEIAATKQRGGRVIAVGTTTVRTLEAEARRERPFEPGRRDTNLFITPGFDFRVIDALVTNFHLPRSTLLALVFGFGGIDLLRRAYTEAVSERYRFYSYGDAMFISRRP